MVKKPARGRESCAAAAGAFFSLAVANSSGRVTSSSVRKIARHEKWLSTQAPSNGASAGESATSGIMVANTRLACAPR